MTQQACEILILDGCKADLRSFPLEAFFSSNGGSSPFLAMSSGCWRGYIGTWELSKNRLYLCRLEREDGPSADLLAKIFPRVSQPIFACWFSGKLRIPRGDIIRHEIFGPVYESELILTIKNGLLMDRTVNGNHVSNGAGLPNEHGTSRAGLCDVVVRTLRMILGR